jgi:hypothetical protein
MTKSFVSKNELKVGLSPEQNAMLRPPPDSPLMVDADNAAWLANISLTTGTCQ